MGPRNFSILALAVSCGLSLCACAHGLTETVSPTAKEPVNMASPEAPAASPAPTAEEVGSRFLGLIDEFKAGAGVNIDRIQEVMRVPLELTDRGNLEATGNVAGGNRFTVAYDEKAGIGLYFTDQNLSPTCPLPITPLLRALPRLESSMPYVVSDGSRAGWYYMKDDGTFVEIGVKMTSAEEPIERDLVCQITVRPAR